MVVGEKVVFPVSARKFRRVANRAQRAGPNVVGEHVRPGFKIAVNGKFGVTDMRAAAEVIPGRRTPAGAQRTLTGARGFEERRPTLVGGGVASAGGRVPGMLVVEGVVQSHGARSRGIRLMTARAVMEGGTVAETATVGKAKVAAQRARGGERESSLGGEVSLKLLKQLLSRLEAAEAGLRPEAGAGLGPRPEVCRLGQNLKRDRLSGKGGPVQHRVPAFMGVIERAFTAPARAAPGARHATQAGSRRGSAAGRVNVS